jgi:N-acetylneuraminic acid mutarotase
MSIRNLLRELIFGLSLALVLVSCEQYAQSPYSDIIFQKKSSPPTHGRASAVAFVINDKGYVALGRDASGKTLRDCWMYDPTNDSWSEMAPYPDSARVKAIAAVVNNEVYVGLGFEPEKGNGINNAPGMLKSFWMYSPKANNWTKKADFPDNATDACVSFVWNNEIYVGAGFDGLGFTRSFWKYNPLSDSWSKLNEFSGEARAGATACGDSVHVFFGTGYQTTNKNDWWEYFPQTDSWNKKNSIPDNGRENAVSLTIKGRYFVSTGRHFGGNYTGGKLNSDILEYDSDKDLWYKRGNIPASGRENAISFTINGKGYIGFGENDNTVLNDFWSFEP